MKNHVPSNRYVIFAVIAIGGTIADLWSKYAVFSQLGGPYKRTGWLIDSWVKFELHTSFNTGALWGMGQGKAWLFAILSVVAFCGVIYWLFIAGHARSLWLTLTLGLITGGTLGNLYDRLGLHGYLDPKTNEPFQAVRDFLRFRFGSFEWATFNVADIFLVCGAIMLVLQSFMQPEPEDKPKPADDKAATPPAVA